MNRRTLVVLLLAAAVGVMAAVIVRSSGFDVSPIQHAARDALRDLERGHVDLAMNRMWFGDAGAVDARPGVTLVAGLSTLDAALRRRFDAGLPDAPLPSADAAFARISMTAGHDDIALAGPPDRQVALVRRDGTWRVDGRPFVDPAIDPDAADAMRGELSRLADRVDAGEFGARDDALAAYHAAVFLGALGGGGPTTRPADANG